MQAQRFHTPGYTEIDPNGGGFGLSYGARNADDTRSELGARFDTLTTLDGRPLILRARAAWAHDWITTPASVAIFQTLPVASFTVTGAAPATDSALLSAGAEVRVAHNISFGIKLDGEFASRSQTYAGLGTCRYAW